MTISESYGLLCTFDYMLSAFRVCDKRVNESAGSRKNSKLKSFPPRTRQREEKSFLPIFHSQLTVRELQLTLDIRRERISFSSREWFILRKKKPKVKNHEVDWIDLVVRDQRLVHGDSAKLLWKFLVQRSTTRWMSKQWRKVDAILSYSES